MNNLSRNCIASLFTDTNHRHIAAGHIRIVQNNKLRKLLCKDLKYKKPVSNNFSNCKTEIKNSLTKFSSEWCDKKGVPTKWFTEWISLVMKKVNKKLKNIEMNLNLVRLQKCSGSKGDFLLNPFHAIGLF